MSETLLIVLHEWAEQAMLRSMNALIRFNQSNGLTFSQSNSLFFLKNEPQATINDLADHLGITKAAVSQLVERMVGQGLVNRQEDPQDRRSKRLTLTPLGDTIVEEAWHARHAWLEELVKTYTPAQQEMLEPALNLLIDGLHRINREKNIAVNPIKNARE
ncbi:MAG: MarR family transcriptional regulator [Anaerolineaceae bacterium]